MHIVWWYWIVFALFMLLAEALTPGGFYLLFIGIAALMTAGIAAVVKTAWIELMVFALLSVLFIAVFRKPLVKKVQKTTPQADIVEFVGETGQTLEIIKAGQEGKIELRGAVWLAFNADTVDLALKARCTIVKREGLRFIVKSIHP
ncbi:MAG: NfeD family protein [Chitinivibrionales bacterium]|nr:NfeD family protein [Chitinivibrionales bacterium]